MDTFKQLKHYTTALLFFSVLLILNLIVLAGCGTSKGFISDTRQENTDFTEYTFDIWQDFDGVINDIINDSDVISTDVDAVERICNPGESECIDANTRRFCNSSGTAWETQDCLEGFVCIDGTCTFKICEPGNLYCQDDLNLQRCNSEGTGFEPAGACEAGKTCMDGHCYSPCELADALRSSIGCVYYAVDTNPIHSWIPGTYAVALSNTDPSRTANVVIEVKNSGVWSTVGTYSVGPRALQTVVLDHRYIDGSAIYQGGAYRITSDLPIIAYQFNPLDGSQSYLSDASLLLPKSGLDKYHIVSAWPQGPADMSAQPGWPAHIQIVATAPTTVTVTSSIFTQGGGGVPALTPGVPTPFNLNEGDFLQLTVANFMDSFTGTYIESDQPVGVFFSNDCANVPADANYCCCEHLEEQLFGLQTWGKRYVASRVPMRGSEGALWVIMASENGTTVNFGFNPSVSGLPPSVSLNRGQKAEYLVTGTSSDPGDFWIESDKPIHVMQYMVAAFMVGYYSSNGDPSAVQAVPVEQYLTDYVVLVPTTWMNDYLVLTRHSGANVTVDGTPVSGPWAGAGSSGFEVARVPVSDGVHVLSGDQPFGVIVVGWDDYDSYAYPGGLNLRIINPV